MKKNDLTLVRPDLASQIHPHKNLSLSTKTISSKYTGAIWWICDKGHEWKESPYNRCKQTDSSCKFCKFSLASTHPKLLNLWHPTKNTDCSPYTITAKTHKKVWWKCPIADEHEWEAPPYNVARPKNTTGCPICRGFKVIKSNCLATTHPDVASEWDYVKNESLTPYDVTAGSGRKVYWKCANGVDHTWIAPIGARTSRSEKKRGKCPFCQGQRVALSNCLATLFPDIAKEWDPEANSNTPYDVSPGSAQKVAWVCKIDSTHKWITAVSSRAGRRDNTGCPYCKGKKTSSTNCLAALYPDIAKEWDFESNSLTPYEVTAGSGRKVSWICKKDSSHNWKATVSDRVHGTGCPYCRGQKVASSNCLAILYPELAKEWDPSANQKTPYDVTPGSNDKIVWRCQRDSSHVWESTVKNRVKGRGCSYCNLGWTIENIRHFVQSLIPYLDRISPAGLYVLFQQNGLLSIDSLSKGKSFVQALKTGRFPKDELEKFVDGLPSLVDQFLNDPDSSLEDNQEDNLQASNNCLSENELILEDDFPIVETKDILSALDSKLFSNLDNEAIDFFIKEAVAKIWQHTFSNETEAIRQLEQYNNTGAYPQEVKKLFLSDYVGAKELQIPSGYNFKVNGEISLPNLMQRFTAYIVKSRRRLGNWSGTGAGKTLSAILSSRVIDAHFTLICCPNNVVSGWKNKIETIYPDSIIFIKDIKTSIPPNTHAYLILNYEFFQQPQSESKLKDLIERQKIDFIVIDEIHYSKQRIVEDMSKRKKVISALLSEAADKNDNLHVLGMSATPVINNLFEGKTLIELITGFIHDDLHTTPSVGNCIALYQKLVSTGIRWLPRYQQKIDVKTMEVDCSSHLEQIKNVSLQGSMVDLEAVLTQVKIPIILENLKPKTIVYTHYLKDIVIPLKEAIENHGWKTAIFSGDDKSGLEEFIKFDADILIASSCLGTGIDGLQHVCNRIIINTLPWTHAEFEQLKGRIYRQGQKSDYVDIIVPLTYASINGERWSWCDSRWNRILFKKSIADAAVDGIIPEGHLRTPAQAYQDTMNWLKRLEEGDLHEIERRKIDLRLSDEVIQKGVRKFGDFSKMNHQLNSTNSATTHKRFQKSPEDWEYYHAMYREARKEWTIVPYQEAIKWCKARPHLVIGDFGCGEALLAKEVENKIYSFDHIAINEDVTPCDIAHVPLDDDSLDGAIFSLSLMGTNYVDYIKEAHRCLKLDGHLWIAEATSRFQNLIEFEDELAKIGFDIVRIQVKGDFTFLRAIKSDRRSIS